MIENGGLPVIWCRECDTTVVYPDYVRQGIKSSCFFLSLFFLIIFIFIEKGVCACACEKVGMLWLCVCVLFAKWYC